MMHEEHLMKPTSMMAYEEMKGKLGERQRIVFNALQELCETQGDATDSEIANHLFKQDPNYVRPRRYELVQMKLVGFSKQRPCQITKKMCLAWRIVQRKLQ